VAQGHGETGGPFRQVNEPSVHFPVGPKGTKGLKGRFHDKKVFLQWG